MADETGLDDAVDEAGLRGVQYRLGWDESGIEHGPEGLVRVHNDLGFEIELELGYVVNHWITLVPCETGDRFRGDGIDPDPSTLPTPWVERIAAADAPDPAALDFPPAEYCHLHYLLARSDESTPRLPTNVDLLRASAYLRGRWRRASEDWQPFESRVDIATADFFELDADFAALSSPRAQIVITRSLGRMFDAVEFDAWDAKAIGRQVLYNLVDPERLTIAVLPADG